MARLLISSAAAAASKHSLQTFLVVRAAVALATKVSSVFSARLHPDDVKDKLQECEADLEALVRDYLLPMAAQMNISPDKLKQVLRVRGFV